MTYYDELVEKYGLIPEAKVGVNEDGDYCMVSIDETCACIRTLQKNNWMSVNIYYKDGTSEELYEH